MRSEAEGRNEYLKKLQKNQIRKYGAELFDLFNGEYEEIWRIILHCRHVLKILTSDK